MSKNIFERLAIEPTQDFDRVKGAYLLAIKNYASLIVQTEDENEITEKVQELEQLKAEFKLVDTKPKLNEYFQSYQRQKAENARAVQAEEEYKQRLSQSKTHKIYIPIDIGDPAVASEDNTLFRFKPYKGQSPLTFAKTFDFDNLAAFLTYDNLDHPRQVGLIFEEAERVIGQHSFYHHALVVCVTVPADCLESKRLSEKDMSPNSGIVNLNIDKYPVLKKGTEFKTADIEFITPLKHYYNTRRISDPTPRAELWPHDMRISNPNKLKTYKDAFFKSSTQNAAISETTEQANITAAQVQAINALIIELENEIESWIPYFNKHIKAEKVVALYTLLQLAEIKNIKAAVDEIIEKYPHVQDGAISTRTHNLLTELKS